MLEELARLHKALSDVTRLRALYLLLELGELCVCDVEVALQISQSKASRHLVTLKQAGLVRDRREGTWVLYRIADDLPPAARTALSSLRAALRDDPVAAADLKRARAQRRSPQCLTRDAKASPRRQT